MYQYEVPVIANVSDLAGHARLVIRMDPAQAIEMYGSKFNDALRKKHD